MSVATDIDLAVRDRQRRRMRRWGMAVLSALVVVVVAWAWAWSDRVYLWDDYRAGWQVAQSQGSCSTELRARYPEAEWAPSNPDLALGPSGQSARAFRTGCVDFTTGSRFAPWHVMRSD